MKEKIKYKVIGKFRGIDCEPEIVEIEKDHAMDKSTLESCLRLEAGVDILISYEIISVI